MIFFGAAQLQTDSTIAPPKKTAVFFNELVKVSQREKGCYDGKVFMHALVSKGLTNDAVGFPRGTVFQEVRSGTGFKTSDSIKEKLGGLP